MLKSHKENTTLYKYSPLSLSHSAYLRRQCFQRRNFETFFFATGFTVYVPLSSFRGILRLRTRHCGPRSDTRRPTCDRRELIYRSQDDLRMNVKGDDIARALLTSRRRGTRRRRMRGRARALYSRYSRAIPPLPEFREKDKTNKKKKKKETFSPESRIVVEAVVSA